MKLIKLLQNAHASEIAAYHAYQGHWESLSDEKEVAEVKRIQKEEMFHINVLKIELKKLGAAPNPRRDRVFTFIGKTIGFLCKVTGWYMPMYIALQMEKLGTKGYSDISLEAAEQGYFTLAEQLLQMAEVEREHQLYFESKL